ncbi:hypothetical protein WMF11_31120 [Sorangium sp. So ce295]|uniref:hypothetical protein n=1 Tax=Sorangium sp. So ce295 TaxID=3133295 RepID=UPI003F63C31E
MADLDFGDYMFEASFRPPGANSQPSMFDVLPDGRLIVCDGVEIYEEESRASRSFRLLRPAGLGSRFVSFVRVAPAGNRAAIGDGDQVVVFELTAPTNERRYQVPNYDAEWYDKDIILISSAGGVSALSISTGIVTPVVRVAGGAPAGVTVDRDRTLFTGNGLDTDPSAGSSRTGTVKAFDHAIWSPSLTGGPPVDFESNGTVIAELLSAGYLGVDASGNMMVGGGEMFPDAGGPRPYDQNYAALISASAIRDALRGGQPVTIGAPRRKLHLVDPDPAPGSFYFMNSNPDTGELYISEHREAAVHVFRRIKESDRILVMACNLHFGDNPGIFQGSTYAGASMTIPMHLEWIDDRPEVKNIRFVFRTHDMETWGGSEGHQIFVNDALIGRLADLGDLQPEGREAHVLPYPREKFLNLVGASRNFNLMISLERSAAAPGRADDFVLSRIETVDFTARLGWK